MGVCLFALTASTVPDDRINELIECKLKEGKTIEDVHAANSKWVVFMNAHVEGGDIHSYVLTTEVGNIQTGHFMYIDSYPSLESWAARDKASEMEAFKPIQAELSAVAECSKNMLYKSRES
jgi:hypothetical protein